jgi:hypothetical protein
MSGTERDGGPAFPVTEYGNGMSLRDWFAGQALAGLNIDDWCDSVTTDPTMDAGRAYGALAKFAYNAADAMIAERNRRLNDE